MKTTMTDALADLEKLAAHVRDGMLADGTPLAGRCEEASGILAAALAEAGHDALLVWGEYAHPDGSHPTTGHCWVQNAGLILDPTRSQFDDGPIVMEMGGSHSIQYRFHYGLRTDELDRPD